MIDARRHGVRVVARAPSGPRARPRCPPPARDRVGQQPERPRRRRPAPGRRRWRRARRSGRRRAGSRRRRARVEPGAASDRDVGDVPHVPDVDALPPEDLGGGARAGSPGLSGRERERRRPRLGQGGQEPGDARRAPSSGEPPPRAPPAPGRPAARRRPVADDRRACAVVTAGRSSGCRHGEVGHAGAASSDACPARGASSSRRRRSSSAVGRLVAVRDVVEQCARPRRRSAPSAGSRAAAASAASCAVRAARSSSTARSSSATDDRPEPLQHRERPVAARPRRRRRRPGSARPSARRRASRTPRSREPRRRRRAPGPATRNATTTTAAITPTTTSTATGSSAAGVAQARELLGQPVQQPAEQRALLVVDGVEQLLGRPSAARSRRRGRPGRRPPARAGRLTRWLSAARASSTSRPSRRIRTSM